MIVLASVNAVGVSEDTSRILREMRAASVTMIAERLERAIAEGELPASLDAHAVAS